MTCRHKRSQENGRGDVMILAVGQKVKKTSIIYLLSLRKGDVDGWRDENKRPINNPTRRTIVFQRSGEQQIETAWGRSTQNWRRKMSRHGERRKHNSGGRRGSRLAKPSLPSEVKIRGQRPRLVFYSSQDDSSQDETSSRLSGRPTTTWAGL